MADNPDLTPTQRWLVRETWPYLESITSKKGFGDFAEMKKSIGMPVANRNDHHDWDISVDPATRQAVMLPSAYELTSTFYEHLFSNNPEMTEIFWRFNLHQSLEKIVAVLDPRVDLHASLRALAERHRGRGILNIDYNKIKTSLQFTFNQLPRNKLSQQAADAWVSSWTLFANAMKVDDKATNSNPSANSAHSTKIPATINTYTAEEVSRHAAADDLWLIIDSKVYNMTKYLKYHPGKGILF